MPTYISMLRGINVGKKQVPMAGLKALYEQLGFTNVVTYIQSGNVIFQSRKKNEFAIAAELAAAIAAEYGFQVPVVVRTVSELEALIDNNPFLKEADIDMARAHVTFLSETPSPEALEKVVAYNYAPDRFAIKSKEVYLHIPGSYGETQLSNAFFERVLKVQATTRNWRTVNKLLELAK